jgi:hypothetical protein
MKTQERAKKKPKQYSKYVIRLGLHKDTKLFSPSLRSFFSLLKKLYTLIDCTVIDSMYVTFTNKCVTSQKKSVSP